MQRAVARYGSARAALRALSAESSKARQVLALEDVQAAVERGREFIRAQEVDVITIQESRYPERLRHLADPPFVLFARGNLDLVNRTILAVVGSRRCTEYGVDTTRALTMPAVRAGAVVVSGLALGIDAVAHMAALEAGGETIAVLGCGIDVCYPRSNRWLFDRIARDGLLLTEFPPGTQPLPFNFPQRNRIIAMLAKAVLVVEATANSGSLITAEHAEDCIDVLAVPGPIGRPTSEGTNSLIADGARIALSADDVLDSLQLGFENPVPEDTALPQDVGDQAQQVWRALGNEAIHLDELALQLSLPAAAVTHSLLELELAGLARQMPGGRFARPAPPL